LVILARPKASAFGRLAPLLLLPVIWLDVMTHEPAQNPTATPGIYQPNLARNRLAMNPQPELGGSRAMISPMGARQFVHSAITNPANNFLIGRLAYGADCNLLDAVPKVDGFLSLMPRECDDFQSLLYDATNADYPHLDDFMGVSQITAPDQIFHWQSRSNFMPLITAGQEPVFLNDSNTLRALVEPGFSPRKIVFLPREARDDITISNTTAATVLDSHFDYRTVDADVEASEPSLVVVSQTYYRDWHAYLDGRPAQLFRANYAFQAVQVPEGRHHVHLVYEDSAFREGAIISLVAWPICLLALFLPLGRKH